MKTEPVRIYLGLLMLITCLASSTCDQGRPTTTAPPTPPETVMPPTISSYPIPSMPAPTKCEVTGSSWCQENSLRGFLIHDGYAAEDSGEIWLAGDQVVPTKTGVLLHSTDGGKTFDTTQSFPQAFRLWRFFVSDRATVWIAGYTREGTSFVLKSVAGAQSWSQVPLPSGIVVVTALTPSNGEIWLAAEPEDSTQPPLYVSADDGQSWEGVPLGVDEQLAPFHILAVSGPTILALSNQGGSLVNGVVSLDSGQTFRKLTLEGMTRATEAVLVDPLSAYVGGYYSESGLAELASAVLLRTRDGGIQWEQLAVPMVDRRPTTFVSMLFLSGETGYAIGGDGTIYLLRITDTLTMQPIPVAPKPELGLEKLFWGKAGTIYAVGTSGLYRGRSENPGP